MTELEWHDDIALLRMNHGKANAFDREFCAQLANQLQDLAGSAGAVVLTGTGRIFSAGVDLVRFTEGGPAYIREFLPALSELFLACFDYPRPLVAALNGHAIAGGCVIASAADRRVMARGKSRIGVTELSVGLPFPVAALEILRCAVPSRHFKELTLAGITYEPEDALERGFIDRVCAPEDLIDIALEEARPLAAIHTRNFRITKRQMRRPYLDRIHTTSEDMKSALLDAWTDEEALATIRGYVARTLGRR